MIREELIHHIRYSIDINADIILRNDEGEEVIKALEQENVLDKIRAEIDSIIDCSHDSIDYDESLYEGAYRNGLYKALDIIDKYKTESEVI